MHAIITTNQETALRYSVVFFPIFFLFISVAVVRLLPNRAIARTTEPVAPRIHE